MFVSAPVYVILDRFPSFLRGNDAAGGFRREHNEIRFLLCLSASNEDTKTNRFKIAERL
jgi:hypothetical protein